MQPDESTLAAVREILATVANVDRAQVTLGSRLRDEFGIDSLSMIDLVVAAEDKFGVRIPDEDAERDLVDFLQRENASDATHAAEPARDLP